jgi:hypothetical protein
MSDPQRRFDLAHPEALPGSGGTGVFRDRRPLSGEINSDSPIPHHMSPAWNYLALNDDHDDYLKDRASAEVQPPPPKGAKPRVQDLNEEITKLADGHVGGDLVGSGECFDLVDEVLRTAGAKSARDFGRITRHGDYQWSGKEVDLKDAKAGDALQFRDYITKITTTTKTTRKTSERIEVETKTETEETRRGDKKTHNHSALVSSVGVNGVIHVVEQSRELVAVEKNDLHIRSDTSIHRTKKEEDGVTIEVETKVVVTHSGRIRVWRPEPRKNK